MLTTLALVVCLGADPSVCRLIPQELPDGMGLAGCVAVGQQMMAAWIEGHPWLVPRAVKCTVGRREDPA
jgi:hypothetical protein